MPSSITAIAEHEPVLQEHMQSIEVISRRRERKRGETHVLALAVADLAHFTLDALPSVFLDLSTEVGRCK